MWKDQDLSNSVMDKTPTWRIKFIFLVFRFVLVYFSFN